MRALSSRERLLQLLLAAVLLAPLGIAFFGRGDFGEAYTAVAAGEELMSRQTALLYASLRSMGLAALATLVALLIGVPSAWALAQRSGGSRRWGLLLLVCCVLPLAIPASVTVSGWVSLIGPAGAASRFKSPVPGISDGGLHWLFSLPGAALVLGTMLWPIVTLEAWPAFRRARNEGYDAALLASSRWIAFWKILVPQTRRELSAGGMLVFLLALSDFPVSSLLLVRTLPTEIHDALMLGNAGSAAAAAAPMLLAIVVIALLLARLPARAAVAQESPELARSGRGSLVVLVFGIIAGFVLPMLGCLYGALNGKREMSAVFGAGVDSLGITVRVAGAAALLAGIAAAARVLFWPETRALPLNAATLVLFAIPGSFLAAGMLETQVDASPLLPFIPASTFAAAIFCFAYFLRFIYIPLRLVEEGLAALDSDLMDAAALAGHGRLSRAGTIALPLVLPHLLAGAALVFILSMGEVPIAAKLSPPGLQPSTLWLFNQQHMGYDESVFGLSLLLGGLAALTLFCAGVVTLWLAGLFRKRRL